MKTNMETLNLESQVTECYKYFMDNKKDTTLEIFADKIKKLQNIMTQMTVTNLVNIIDRVVEDGRKKFNGENRQYNVSSIQVLDENINFICYEVIGFDTVDKKYLLDNTPTYINFTDVIRVY